MAIKIKRPTVKLSAVEEFVESFDPRQDFWKRYARMVDDGSTAIIFTASRAAAKLSC